MRILIPTLDYPPIEGAISMVTREAAHAFARMGHEVTVAAPQRPDVAAFDAAEPVRVVRFHGYGVGWARMLLFYTTYRRLLRDADLVLAMDLPYGGLLGRFTGRCRHVPYVCFAYAAEFLAFRGSVPRAALYRSVYRHAAAVIAMSSFARANLRLFGVPDSHVRVVLPPAPPPRAVSEEAAARVRHDLMLGAAPVILAVAPFIPGNNHLVLVRAMAQVLEAVPGAHLVMVGSGPMREPCVETAHDMGIEAFVHCPDRLDDGDIAALYATCTLFALPAGAHESGEAADFGLVFAGAAAYGKPVVAGRAGGVADVVADGETGRLVPPDDPDAVAAAVTALLNEPARAEAMGVAARRRFIEALNGDTFAAGVLEAAGLGEG
ncbi:MAG: glycosyltransferase family 4 protein [Candidatus Hydrogenedentota bacterium]